uniref:Uncharacterized protein n=1 Tax=Arundo donax TaxID=35708 RepID=A0A0A9BE42_ARUDO
MDPIGQFLAADHGMHREVGVRGEEAI